MDHGLEAAIRDKSACIGVVGLGYVGLPLINAFVAAGYRCLGFDIDRSKVDALLSGQSYIQHIESATIAKWITESRFEATHQAMMTPIVGPRDRLPTRCVRDN